MASPAATTAGRLSDLLLPPALSLRLRARLARPGSGGIAPPAVLLELVPPGRPAVDVGAHRGLWSYWMSRRTSVVHAFEPNPDLYSYLARSRMHSVRAYEVALSDAEGSAVLSIPEGGRPGRGTIVDTVGTGVARVVTRPLDAYALTDVGFMKVDVEGHEEAVLRGAVQTLQSCQPNLLVEIEERHNPGAVSRIPAALAELGYGYAYCVMEEQLQPLAAFDLASHQLEVGDDVSSAYVNNFVFASTPLR
jgi:FkbM family methyltransferase